MAHLQDLAPEHTAGPRRTVAGATAALAAAVALVTAAAGTGQAAPRPAAGGVNGAGGAVTAPAAPNCGAAADAAAAPAAEPGRPAAAPAAAARQIFYRLPSQLPIGLWSPSTVTLRTPVLHGTVRLDVTSRGFSTASLAVQRYVPQTHRWIDLSTTASGGLPTHSVFSFPITADASPSHPYAVALRLQDLDRPGTVSVAASVADGHGHIYRAPTRTAAATRPAVTVDGWPSGTTLVRGGAAHAFTVTVKNTTDRAYPSLSAAYFAYGARGGRTLTAKDLLLQEYRSGHGWVTVPLLPDGCDPGIHGSLPASARPLAPGATAVHRLRLAVAASAPKEVTSVDAGLSVGNGDASFFFRTLPFAIRAGA